MTHILHGWLTIVSSEVSVELVRPTKLWPDLNVFALTAPGRSTIEIRRALTPTAGAGVHPTNAMSTLQTFSPPEIQTLGAENATVAAVDTISRTSPESSGGGFYSGERSINIHSGHGSAIPDKLNLITTGTCGNCSLNPPWLGYRWVPLCSNQLNSKLKVTRTVLEITLISPMH